MRWDLKRWLNGLPRRPPGGSSVSLLNPLNLPLCRSEGNLQRPAKGGIWGLMCEVTASVSVSLI